jgi:hypothetical protein
MNCENIAQSMTQIYFLLKLIRNFHSLKSSLKTWATFVIFEKVPEKQSPKTGKFAQSGHPECSLSFLAGGNNKGELKLINLSASLSTPVFPAIFSCFSCFRGLTICSHGILLTPFFCRRLISFDEFENL